MIYIFVTITVLESFLLVIAFWKKIKHLLLRLTFSRKKKKLVQVKFFDEENSWYSNVPFIILHGAGGLNQRKYNNSREGICRGIDKNYKVIEVDISVTADRIPVLTHRFMPDDERIFEQRPLLSEFLSSGALEGENAITLELFIKDFSDSDPYYLIDCQHGTEDVVIEWFEKNTSKQQRQKVIFQVHSINSLKKVYHKSVFANIHYNGSSMDVISNIKQLKKYNVHTCSMSDDEFTSNKEDVLSIIGTGMHVFAFTINYERRLRKLVELGISGCFSDFLSPDVFKNIKI